MFDVNGKRFFGALRDAAELQFGGEHPCVEVFALAAKTNEMSDIQVAQDALTALPADVTALLMEAVHKAMREDPAALLDAWNGPGDRRKPM